MAAADQYHRPGPAPLPRKVAVEHDKHTCTDVTNSRKVCLAILQVARIKCDYVDNSCYTYQPRPSLGGCGASMSLSNVIVETAQFDGGANCFKDKDQTTHNPKWH